MDSDNVSGTRIILRSCRKGKLAAGSVVSVLMLTVTDVVGFFRIETKMANSG